MSVRKAHVLFQRVRLFNQSQLRQLHKCAVFGQAETAAATTAAKHDPMSIPPPEGVDRTFSPKIEKLSNEIIALSLIEVAELSQLLTKRLNLPDVTAPMGFVAQAAPAEVEEEAPKKEKTVFTIKLVKFDANSKVALIKEMKNILPDTNLVQAKKFVESAPVVIKSDIPKDEAEKLKELITKAGGEVEIL